MNKFRLKTGIVLSLIAFAIIACKKDNSIGGSDANFKPSEMFNVNFTDESHLTAKFTDASKDPGSYYWDFGDGTSSTEPSPTHTYKDSGRTKYYTITRIVIGKGGYRDSLQDYVEVYSAIPKINKIEYCKGESYNGEYRIALKADWYYAKKVAFYLKKNNGDSILLYSRQPNYSSSSADYNDNNSPLTIGSFDAATFNQAYKLKIVYTGIAGITKDTTVDVVPTITKIRIEKVELVSIPVDWGTTVTGTPPYPLNLAINADERQNVDPNKTIRYPTPFIWSLNIVYDYASYYQSLIYRVYEEDGTKTNPDIENAIDWVDLGLPDQVTIANTAVVLQQYNQLISGSPRIGTGVMRAKIYYHYE